jgi:hypothetical protein
MHACRVADAASPLLDFNPHRVVLRRILEGSLARSVSRQIECDVLRIMSENSALVLRDSTSYEICDKWSLLYYKR